MGEEKEDSEHKQDARKGDSRSAKGLSGKGAQRRKPEDAVLKMLQEGKTEQLRGERCQRCDAQRSGHELGVDWWEGKGTERNGNGGCWLLRT